MPTVPVTLAVIVMLAGIAILFFTIRGLIRVVRQAVVARLPAVAEQNVCFDRAGTYVLHLEHPRFSSSLRRAAFSLRDAVGAREVRSWPILFRTTSSGYARVRLSVRGFAVERPGRYVLSATGIDPGADASQDALVFTVPYASTMVLLILGIVLGGFCLIGGLVFTALGLAGII